MLKIHELSVRRYSGKSVKKYFSAYFLHSASKLGKIPYTSCGLKAFVQM